MVRALVAACAGLGALLALAGPVRGAAEGGQAPGPSTLDDATRTVRRSCVSCHNDRTLRGNLSLETFDLPTVADDPEQVVVGEKMIRKLRAGMMPPPGAPRPDEAELLALVESLEGTLDAAAGPLPDPGGRAFQRLNRPEYERAVQDLLALDVDASDWLPLDQMSGGFDNMAEAQTVSPTLVEAYLNAAAEVSRMAVGDRDAPTLDWTYGNNDYVSQHPWDHVPGTPYGTRGGMAVDHVFPADATYVFEMTFASGANTRLEDLDVSIDGERVALLSYNTDRRGGADGRGGAPMRTVPIPVRAGQHRVAAAFVKRSDGPYEDLIRPHDWSFAGGGSGGAGITTLPHLRTLIIRGPLDATGLSSTPSRERIFTCRPTAPENAEPCARSIVARLAGDAYRRALSPDELEGLMPFYREGADRGGFEIGVRTALEAVLASPHFVFRLEREPVDAPRDGFRLADTDLASRLSFFLWGTAPDTELRTLADAGDLDDVELERQALRMLADSRSEALGSRFAAQWFRLQDMDKVRPDPNFFPNYDEHLAASMRQETETFFSQLVRENGSLLDLFRADYTYLDERLARHYGVPGVAGAEFRRVAYPDDRRRGILGHGSVLVLTSLANRTSPVLRGKWVMEVLMGTPPPPPPPDVPGLDETEGAVDGRRLTTRERMELHRSSPACSSCHRFMDPIGLALDNFDVTAKWRLREYGMPLDTRGTFYDGTEVSTPPELVEALLTRPTPLVRTFTENLLAYAIGRRVEAYDQPTVRAIARAAERDDYRIASFVLGVVRSDAFQRKRGLLGD